MENKVGMVKREDGMELPPGFRFHPTDEELITHYLLNKAIQSNFEAIAMGEVDMNRVEPWELPWRAKLGEKEWYFFCVRDKKYPSGHRTNRATASGYWKATGKDKEIFKGKTLVGMKKTLVFYKGRAPKGEKSNWVAHEYRLEGEFSLHKLPKSSKNDWVISRVFHKTCGGKKVHISGLVRSNSEIKEVNSLTMPTLRGESAKPELEAGHVHCFSRPVIAPPKLEEEDMIPCFSDTMFASPPNPLDSDSLSRLPGLMNPFHDSRNMIGSYGQNLNQGFGNERGILNETENSSFVSNVEMENKSFEEHGVVSTSVGIQDFGCIWSY